MAIDRVFLDWDGPCLPRAADFLLKRFGADGSELANTIVAVPGGRAGRRLEEILIHKISAEQSAWTPPRIMTAGRLPEELYERKKPFADDLVQQLAWVEAVKSGDPAELKQVLPTRPADDDLPTWLALGETLGRLHRELAADGLDFESVLACGSRVDGFHEQARWRALWAIQRRYLDLLDRLGLWDLQTARLFAIRNAQLRTDAAVVLVGTVDLNNAQRLMLDQIAEQVTALVFAPRAWADRFDGHGCLLPQAWQEVSVELSARQIEIALDPARQAAAVVRSIAAFHGRHAASEITVGVPGEEVVPYIQQQLEACGVPARYGVGRPVSQSGPYRLLAAAANYLESGRFADFAALVRHPAIHAWLLRRKFRGDWLSQLDAYHADHLPSEFSRTWVGRPGPGGLVGEVHSAIAGLLQPFDDAERLPLGQWGQPILDLLVEVFGHSALDPNLPAERTTLAACEKIRAAVQKHLALADCGSLEPVVSGAEAIRMTLGRLDADRIAPKAEPDAVELLGWLELPLDDTPAVIVTEFNEGVVPASLNADLFLPNQLRRELGIEDNDRRYARDVYALSVLVAGRKELKLIAGRRTAEGDPLRPSRLLFACDRETVATRVIELFDDRQVTAPALLLPGALRPGREKSTLEVPRPRPLAEPVTSMRVTEFRDYLACPYRYYLRHRLELAALSDSEHELDGGAFGSLAHEVLAEFGKDPIAPSSDEKEIFAWLSHSLDRAVLRQYGPRPRAALRVQVEQLRLRLKWFAPWQAEWTRKGWRIEHVEAQAPADRAALLVDGRPMGLRGRIDRIDRNQTSGHFVLFDYKTSDTAKTPEAVHRKGDRWVDLQLPLYQHLAAALDVDGPIRVGYIVLPKDVSRTGPLLAEWNEEDFQSAWAVAQDVVRQVRAENFWPKTEPPPVFSEEFAAICQDGQFAAALASEFDPEEM
jgi:RecB family exonuclease